MSRNRPAFRPSDRGRLVLGKDNGVFGTYAAARRAALFAVVLLLDENPLAGVDSVDAEQARSEERRVGKACRTRWCCHAEKQVNHRQYRTTRLPTGRSGAAYM